MTRRPSVRWFISVWCFFAAALSVIVWLHFVRGSRATGARAGTNWQGRCDERRVEETRRLATVFGIVSLFRAVKEVT
jgi:hypothetical protein